MARNLVSALVLASTAGLAVVLAATTPGNAYADDITIDTTPSPAANARADGQPNVFRRGAAVRVDASEWTLQSNQPVVLQSASTQSQAQAEYKASREHVNALLGEDSGSAYFMKSAPGRTNGTATMGSAPR